jgi:hypothetical protein
VTAAAAAAGCGADTEGGGSGGDDTAVRAVVARFGVATRDHDYQTICDDLLADNLVSNIETIGLPCESALQKGLGDVHNATLRITDVSIAGSRALVSVHTTADGQPPSDDALQLIKESGRWKIASLASPQGQSGSAPATTAAPSSTAPPATTTTSTTSKRRSRSGSAHGKRSHAGKHG